MSRAVVALVAILTLVGCASDGGTGTGAAPPGSGPTPSRADCVASVEEVTVRPGDPPGSICVVVGATLRVTSAPSKPRWQPLSTSDPAVVSCDTTYDPAGTLSGTCRALSSGKAVLASTTGAPTEARPDTVWETTVTVVD